LRKSIIDLAYIGILLALTFGEKRQVVGFDINTKRFAELNKGGDFTREVSPAELAAPPHLSFTDSLDYIADLTVFIVIVPPPIDDFRSPDLVRWRS